MNLSNKIHGLYRNDITRRQEIQEMWALIQTGEADLNDDAFNALMFYGYHCYMPFTEMYKMLQMQDQRRNAKKQRYAWEKKHNAEARIRAYEEYLKFYPQHLEALKSLAQQYLSLGYLPNNYWYKFYANPKFSLEFERLPEYLSILELLVALLNQQPECEAQKQALERIERLQDFLLRLERQPQPKPLQNKYGQLEGFHMPFFVVEASYKRLEINYLLKEAEQALLWHDLLHEFNSEREFRSPNLFQTLSAKPISWAEFLGVRSVKYHAELGQPQLNKLSEYGREQINRGLISDLFFGPYGSDKCEVDYLAPELKSPKQRRLALFERLFGEGFGLDLNGRVLAEQLDIYAFSTNTSRYFDAGNEWYGANFWALVHKEKPQIVFLMSSFTD